MSERCGNCRFFDGGDNEQSTCSLNPPSVVYGGDGNDPNTWWPVVFEDDWCGKWEFNEATRPVNPPKDSALVTLLRAHPEYGKWIYFAMTHYLDDDRVKRVVGAECETIRAAATAYMDT